MRPSISVSDIIQLSETSLEIRRAFSKDQDNPLEEVVEVVRATSHLEDTLQLLVNFLRSDQGPRVRNYTAEASSSASTTAIPQELQGHLEEVRTTLDTIVGWTQRRPPADKGGSSRGSLMKRAWSKSAHSFVDDFERFDSRQIFELCRTLNADTQVIRLALKDLQSGFSELDLAINVRPRPLPPDSVRSVPSPPDPSGEDLPWAIRTSQTSATSPEDHSLTDVAEMRLRAAIQRGSLDQVVDIVTNDFDALVQGSDNWLLELVDLGYSKREIGKVLLEQQVDSPWIYFDPWVIVTGAPIDDFHAPKCAHRTPSDGNHLTRRVSHGDPRNSADVRDAVVSLCGLAGVVPTEANKHEIKHLVTFSGTSRCQVQMGLGMEPETATMERAFRSISGVLDAARHLQESYVMCDRFTMACTGRHDSLVELHEVRVHRITRLRQVMLEYRQNPSSRLLKKCEDEARRILEPLRLLNHGPAWLIGRLPSHISIHICALAVQALSLGLLLYCQAHLGTLRPFFLDRELTDIELSGSLLHHSNKGPCSTIRVSLRKLACMRGALESDVLVFSRQLLEAEGFGGSYEGSRGSIVLAAADAIIDTWGPGSIITDDYDDLDSICGIVLRGGIIQRESSDPNLSYLCHWTKLEEINSQPNLSWRRDQKIRVGAIVEVNQQCQQTITQLLNKFHGHARPLGTRDSGWQQQSREIGFQAGYYATLVFNGVWDKHDGLSLKKKYLDELQGRVDFLAFLESRSAVEISSCSGLARRVTTRKLVADLMPLYVQRGAWDLTIWDKLQDLHMISQVLANGDLCALILKMRRSDSTCLEMFLKLVETILLSLKDTGLQPSGNEFVAALIPEDPFLAIGGISIDCHGGNYWLRALRDTATCATFAYFTPSCLEIKGTGCRETSTRWDGKVSLSETSVELRSDLSMVFDTRNFVPALEHGQLHQFGRRDADTVYPLCARVSRPTATGTPRLVIMPSNVKWDVLRRLRVKGGWATGYLQESLEPSTRGVSVLMESAEAEARQASSRSPRPAFLRSLRDNSQ